MLTFVYRYVDTCGSISTDKFVRLYNCKKFILYSLIRFGKVYHALGKVDWERTGCLFGGIQRTIPLSERCDCIDFMKHLCPRNCLLGYLCFCCVAVSSLPCILVDLCKRQLVCMCDCLPDSLCFPLVSDCHLFRKWHNLNSWFKVAGRFHRELLSEWSSALVATCSTCLDD